MIIMASHSGELLTHFLSIVNHDMCSRFTFSGDLTAFLTVQTTESEIKTLNEFISRGIPAHIEKGFAIVNQLEVILVKKCISCFLWIIEYFLRNFTKFF